MALDPATLSPAQQRSLLLEYRLGIDCHSIDELCAKYDLRRSAFQRLRTLRGHPLSSEEELVIAGVCQGADTVDRLIGYLDYRNHARYSEVEVRAFIANLVSIAVLVERDGAWQFAPDAPAAARRFVFTAPAGAALQPSDFGARRHPSLRGQT